MNDGVPSCEDVAPAYYRGSVGYHRISSFGHFSTPLAGSSAQDGFENETKPNVFIERERIERELVETRLVDAMYARRSVRAYSGHSIELSKIATLLWGAYGYKRGSQRLRVVPSAGGLYPLSFRVAALRLDRSGSGASTPALWTAVLRQDGVGFIRERDLDDVSVDGLFVTQHIDYGSAAAILFAVGDLNIVARDYGERGYRMLHLDAGHAFQNLGLIAATLDVEHVCIGGFDDAACASLLELNEPREVLLYGAVLGGCRS